MILVVGLGNPGEKYSNTRHNIGFITIDYLIDSYKFSQEPKKRFKSIIASGNISSNNINKVDSIESTFKEAQQINQAIASSVKLAVDNEVGRFKSIGSKNIVNKKLILAKPQTFMNLSGEAVKAIANYYKIATNNIIVIHDDADLPLGKIKFKFGGGNGGHNGLKSIDQHLSAHYYRIRIGIGKHAYMGLTDYVLGEFTKDDIFTLTNSIEKIAASMPLFYNGDIMQFQKAISA